MDRSGAAGALGRPDESGEVLDAYDELGAHLGIRSREEVHEHGFWHRVFHCLVVARRDGVPVAVLQLRHPNKRAFPGLLDISAAGHLHAGERPEDGIRELHEELGLDIAFSDLTPIGERRLVDTQGEGVNREIIHVYLTRDDRLLTEYRPQRSEVTGLFDANLRELVRLVAGSLDQMSVSGVIVDDDGALQPVSRTITRFDLVPDVDDYLIEVLTRAQRFIPAEPGSEPDRRARRR